MSENTPGTDDFGPIVEAILEEIRRIAMEEERRKIRDEIERYIPYPGPWGPWHPEPYTPYVRPWFGVIPPYSWLYNYRSEPSQWRHTVITSCRSDGGPNAAY